LFDHIATAAVEILTSFTTQGMASMMWAFARNRVSNTQLFERVADNILESDKLSTFEPQELANIVWAFGRAENLAVKAEGGSLPRFLEKVADHIVALDDNQLARYRPSDLHKILGAFGSSTVGLKSNHLFEKLANVFIAMQYDKFIPQEIALILWAFACAGNLNKKIFSSMEQIAKSKLAECNCQDLANIAWSYAVVNVPAPSLFDADFLRACLKKEGEFNREDKSQLYQWHLWQEELNSDVKLPLETCSKCRDAFVSSPTTTSSLQIDILRELYSIGLRPGREVPTPKGYFLDALVVIDGKDIGIEIDGPSHFTGRKPIGKTILKRRQVTNLEGITLVSIPYWEWDKRALGKDHSEKQAYLRSLLGIDKPKQMIKGNEKVNEKVKVEPKIESR